MKEKIEKANQRLKDSNLGVCIQQLGNRLYLRATLPPKPDSHKTKSYQQRIKLGVYANGAGLQFAEKEARKLGDAIAFGSFSWDDYLEEISLSEVKPINVLVNEFEQDYFVRRKECPKSRLTFDKDYQTVFKQLPQQEELNKEIILELLTKTEADSRSRKRYYIALNSLAKFAELNIDLSRYKGEYSPEKLIPRDLPDDKLIVEIYHQIKNAQWQWVYGILATFGLRPHEIFYLNPQSKLPILEVEHGKTNERKVWALYPEWVDQFDLQNFKVPNCTGKNNGELGHRVSTFFRRQKIPFKPYDLRHKWAVRALEFGLDVSLASQQMGHSVKVHCETYQRWIGEDVHQRAYNLIVNQPERPIAP